MDSQLMTYTMCGMELRLKLSKVKFKMNLVKHMVYLFSNIPMHCNVVNSLQLDASLITRCLKFRCQCFSFVEIADLPQD